MVRKAFVVLGSVLALACGEDGDADGSASGGADSGSDGSGEPLFPSSVVGTDFDFIRATDEDVFSCLKYDGLLGREMPNGDEPLHQDAYVFTAYFTDGTEVELNLSNAFGSETVAEAEATRYVPRLGKLPTVLRDGLAQVKVFRGDKGASAQESAEGLGFFLIYDENATDRISTNDLEETVFHESVHASWDAHHAHSPEWLAAQQADGQFITSYAMSKPMREDLAESALFAYTMIHYPDRFPPDVADAIRSAIPNRIAFVEKLLPAGQSTFHSVEPAGSCD